MKETILIGKLLIMSMVSFYYHAAFGQTAFPFTTQNAYFYTPKNMGTATPQVTDMIRYGNLQVNKYHGLLDFGIQLEGYKDQNFNIPLSLKYISTGFIPSKRPSYVGYNWVLNCGGVITRRLNGSPDDTHGYYMNEENMKDNKYLLDGMLVAIRDGRMGNYSENQLKNFQIGGNDKGKGTYYASGDFKHEFEPDIYTFSFGEHYGNFIIGYDGTPVLLDNKDCKIDINQMAVQSYSTTAQPVSSTISITTSDGFVYTFGGTYKYFEYFLPNNPDFTKKMPRYITSWFLKSIKAPNSRTIDFYYRSELQLNKYSYIAYSHTETSTQVVCSPPSPACPGGVSNIPITSAWLFEIKDKIYTPILDSIKITGNTTIAFEYDKINKMFYSNEAEDFSFQLKKIKHKHNNLHIKGADFTYQTSGNYFFLKTVIEQGKKHEFNYKLFQTLPAPTTLSVDHWGYWKGGYETTITENERENYCKNIHSLRNTNPSLCDIGLLEEIIYPTKGKSKIFYEYNRYNNAFEFNNDQYAIISKSTITPCGGARVKKIEDYELITNNSPSNIKTFHYRDIQNHEVGSLGILKDYATKDNEFWMIQSAAPCIYSIPIPPYIASTTCYRTDLILMHNISANTYGSDNVFSEYHIGYPHVREETTNNGKKYYRYSSWIDTPDKVEYGIKCGYMCFEQLATSDQTPIWIAHKFGTLTTNDMSRFRGRLLNETTIDNLGDTIQTKQYDYNFNAAGNTYQIALRSSPRSFGYYKIYTTPCKMLQQQITDKKNNISQSERYTYNSFGLLQEATSNKSNGEQISVRYLYPFDSQSSDTVETYVLNRMTAKNILSKYVEKYVILGDGQDARLIKAEHNHFAEVFPNIFTTKRLDILSAQKPVNMRSWKSESQQFLKPETYYKYNNMGNIIETKSADSELATMYLWGYSGQYPVAEIKNVRYDDFMNALSGSQQSFLNYMLNSNMTATDPMYISFRDMLINAVPNTEVTLYTYRPLIGMTSKTNSRGVTTHYDYDGFGRLKEAYYYEDGDTNKKRTIEKYDYHYRQ